MTAGLPYVMPESVADRPTSAHEYVFLCAKSERYYYDRKAGAEKCTFDDGVTFSKSTAARRYRADYAHDRMPTSKLNGIRPAKKKVSLPADTQPQYRNMRNVWTIVPQPTSFKHFAVMPELLAERCIAIGSAVGDHVLDPFGGSGTTGKVAQRLGRIPTLIELNKKYESLITDRTAQTAIRLEGAPHA